MSGAPELSPDTASQPGLVTATGDAIDRTHQIFGLSPEEDSGSETLARYRYQAEVAARDCLVMLTQDAIDYVVCEWHEDYVVACTDGSIELVSVKHREDDQGPWTLAELCKSGGLAHLFDRWCACERASNVRLRLATNAALNPAKGNAATMAKMCGPRPEVVDGLAAMVKKIAQQMLKVRWKQPYTNIPETPKVAKDEDIQLPGGFAEQIAGFLAVLEIRRYPQRLDIADVNIQSYLASAIAHLQVAHVDLEATYRAIVNRIERANRDEADRGQLAVYVADPSRVQYNTQAAQRIARRMLDRKIISREFVYTATQLSTYPRNQVPMAVPGGAMLGRKLIRGQVASDEAMFAEDLRAAWYATWSQRRSGLVGDETDLYNLSLSVLDTAFRCRNDAQAQTTNSGAFGPRMNGLIAERLTVGSLPSPPPFNLNDLHLRGLAYQLCDECRFYFSDPFDAREDAA